MRSNKKQSSQTHDSSWILRLLTFATAIIGSQFDVPLATAVTISTAATTTQTTLTAGGPEAMKMPEEAMQPTTFSGTTQDHLIEDKTSNMPLSGDFLSPTLSNTTRFSLGGMMSKGPALLVSQLVAADGPVSEGAQVVRMIGKSRITSRNSEELEDGHSATATSPVAATHGHGSTGTSKFPLDFKFTKNHWSLVEPVSFGVSPPAASASSSFLLPLSSASSASHLSPSMDTGAATTTGRDVPPMFRIGKHKHDHRWGPFFEGPLNSTAPGDNVITTAHLYTQAVLNCRVGMLKDKTVMWVRRTTEKVSLLTVGNVTYSGDPRIHVRFQYPNNWRLLINPVHWEDEGVYMCQVSTHPPRVFTTNLTILEPPLRLIDEQEREVGDRYYKAGSTIDLQCQVSRSFVLKEKAQILKSIEPLLANNHTKASDEKRTAAAAITGLLGANSNALELIRFNQTAKQMQSAEKQFSGFIYWRKDDKDFLPPGAVKHSSISEQWLTVRVTIRDALLADSGNYSCSIGRLFTAIVQVQVLTGELPAAVQHSGASATTIPLISRFSKFFNPPRLRCGATAIMILLIVSIVARIEQRNHHV